MARKREPELELSVEEITPSMAAEWLKSNTRNRKVSDRLVMVYAEAMENDEWTLNGEPIIFDKKGTLQSGQHRLLACTVADTPFKSVVVRGAEPESLYSLDSGRRRRLSDVLTIRGEKDVMTLATAVTHYWRWTVGAMDRPTESATTTHLLKVLDETPGLRDAMAGGRRYHTALGFSTGLMTALHYIFSLADEEDAEEFNRQVFEGTNLTSTDPAFVLRRWAERAKNLPRRPNSTVIAAIMIKAWNAFREHRPIQLLKYAGGETFPEVV